MELLKFINSSVHVVAASLSILIGTAVIVIAKGSKRHKQLGVLYFWLMVVNNVTSLFIVKAIGRWFFPHYLAIVGLAVLIPGYAVTRRKRSRYWLKIHIVCMIFSYYLLLGGAVNEAYLHIPSIRPLLESQDPIFGMTHSVVFFACLVMLIYFLVRSGPKRFNPSRADDGQ